MIARPSAPSCKSDIEEDGWRRALVVVLLAACLSSIYDLPYFLSGPLRPVALQVFGLNNVQAGLVLSLYGFAALLFYLPGGSFTDWFLSPTHLMIAGQMLTGIAGFFLATLPSFSALCYLSVYFAFTSVFIFWAALIKAFRMLTSTDAQGWAWSQLFAWKLLLIAVKQSLIVQIYSASLPNGEASASLEDKQVALQTSIVAISVLTCSTGALLGFALHFNMLPLSNKGEGEQVDCLQTSCMKAWSIVAGSVKVWLIATVLLSCYFCHSVINYFPQYAINGYQLSQVNAAWIDTLGTWVMPLAVLAVGYFADRISTSLVVKTSLFLMFVVCCIMGFNMPWQPHLWQLLLYVALCYGASAVSNSVIWALLQEADIPLALTGNAVGFISFVGYTPDVFSPAVLGYFMDSAAGYPGDQHCLLVGAAFALLGLVACHFYRSELPPLLADVQCTLQTRQRLSADIEYAAK